MWKVLAAVAGAGMLGGVANGLVSGTATAGLAMPRFLDVGGASVLQLGFLGNMLVGAVAAVVSFGLYGQLASAPLFRSPAAGGGTPASPATLTLAAFTGAMLVGFSGGRWMTAEADKQLNHATAVTVAQAAAQAEARGQFVAAGPRAAGPFTALSKIVQDATPVMAVEEAVRVRGQMGGGDPP